MNYGYQDEYVPLNKDEVLKRISQDEIFKLVFKEHPEIGKYYTNPTRRGDTNAGCFFEYHNGKLFFVDFGGSRTHSDCFNILEDYYSISFYEALVYINDECKLGLDSNGVAKPIIYELPKSKNVLRHTTDIMFKSRPFSIYDKKFWFDRYGTSKESLMEDSVFAILWYKIHSTKRNGVITIRPNTICYAYCGFENMRVKIYTPFGNKSNKWISNCIKDDVGGIDSLPVSGKLLIIAKSYKDYRVLKNYGLNVVWFQNEGMIPNDTILISLCKRFDNIVVLFDNDKQGFSASAIVTAVINSHFPHKAKSIFIPNIRDDVKDPSDMYYHMGRIELLVFLTKNKLI